MKDKPINKIQFVLTFAEVMGKLLQLDIKTCNL